MAEEFPCPNCRMRLEVSREQLGKQVRCPVCGVISVFGSRDESTARDDWSPIGEAARVHPFERPEVQPGKSAPGSNSAWQPIEPTKPRQAETSAAGELEIKAQRYVETYSNSTNEFGPPDQAWWTGFVLSLLSLGGGTLPCFCCLLYPFGPTLLGIAAIIVTRTSNSGPKLVNYLIAAIGLISSLTGLLVVAISSLS